MTEEKYEEYEGIPWFVLTEIERNDMQDKGVEMKRLGMVFTKQNQCNRCQVEPC